MDRLAAIRVFLAIADAGSLSAASERLGMPLSTVSRHLKALEDAVNTRLLTRTTRRLALTEPGRTYLETCRRVLGDLDMVERHLAGEKAEPQEFDLLQAATVAPKSFLRRTGIPGLAIVDLAGMPGGTPGNLARLTARSLMPLADIAEAIVVDSSPLGATAEVLELIPAADVVVMVVRLDHTFTDTATRAIQVVRSLTEVPVLLAVVGDAGAGSPYYYEYSATRSGRRRGRKAARASRAEQAEQTGQADKADQTGQPEQPERADAG